MNSSTTPRFREVIGAYLGKSRGYFALPQLSVGLLVDGERLDTFESPVNTGFALSYKVGSLTKLVTAIAALKLQEDGALSLADPVSKHLDWFDDKDPDPVTVRDLLLHNGGLPRGEFCNSNPTVDKVREFVVASDPTLKSARKRRIKYSNLGYILLGVVIEQAGGEAYSKFVRRRLFTPLKMHHSGFGNESQASPITTPHRLSCFSRANSTPYDFGTMPLLSAPHASSDMFSTIKDFSNLLSCLLNDGLQDGTRILEPASITVLFGMAHPMNQRLSAGPGFYIVKTPRGRILFENGEHFGHSASMLMIPGEKFAIVAMTNRGSAGQDLSCIVNTIARYHSSPDKPNVLENAYHDNGSIVGSYVSDRHSELAVSVDADKLYISIDHEERTPLVYAGQGRFLKTNGSLRKYMICLDHDGGSLRGLCVGPEYFRRQQVASVSGVATRHTAIVGIYCNSTVGKVALLERDGKLILVYSPFKEAELEELSPGVFVQQNGPFERERVTIDSVGNTLALGALHFTKTAERY